MRATRSLKLALSALVGTNPIREILLPLRNISTENLGATGGRLSVMVKLSITRAASTICPAAAKALKRRASEAASPSKTTFNPSVCTLAQSKPSKARRFSTAVAELFSIQDTVRPAAKYAPTPAAAKASADKITGIMRINFSYVPEAF